MGKKRNVLEKTSLCLLHRSVSISLVPPQLSLFVYLIYGQIRKKRNRCGVSVPLFYSPLATPGKGGEKKQTAVNKVVIVSHCDIWQCDFLRELCSKAFPAEGRNQNKRPRRRRGSDVTVFEHTVHTYIHTYMCIYVYTYVSICLCVVVYSYIYTHTYIF